VKEGSRMMCFKLFQFPTNNSRVYESLENALKGGIVYSRDGFVVVSLGGNSACSMCSAIREVKVRTVVLSRYILKRAVQSFVEYGYEVFEKYDEDGDLVQLRLKKDDEDIEINTDGYVPLISGSAGCTISRDVSEHWEGNASLKAVTDGVNPMAGFMTNQYAKVKGLSQYILSGYFKGGGDLLYYISWLDINQTTISQASVHVNPSSTWKRFSLSATAPASAVYALLLVRTATNQAVTWWIDGLQIEEALPGQTVPSPCDQVARAKPS
jgi:hypothetical protein